MEEPVAEGRIGFMRFAWRLLCRPAVVLRRSIAARLYLGFGVSLLILLAVGALAWQQTSALAHQLDVSTTQDPRRIELAATMQLSIKDLALTVAGMALPQDEQDMKYRLASLDAARKRYDAAFAELRQDLVGAAAGPKSLLAEIETIDVNSRNLLEATASMAVQRAGAADAALADSVAQNLDGPLRVWVASLDKLQSAVRADASQAAAGARRRSDAMSTVMAAACLVGLLAGVLAAAVIGRGITRPLQGAVAVARAVARGDLAAPVAADRDDEVGALLSALAEMQANLRRLVGGIREAAATLQVASSEVAAGNADLSQRTERAAASLQLTAASVDRLAAGVRVSAESAQTASGEAQTASARAERGGALVSELVVSMNGIGQASRRIAEITGVIDGIAFQTNILALNAAVEASRAGDQGRGFAVVAAEVRALAQRSAEAAKEIQALIESSGERVDHGSRLVRAAGSAMEEIVASIARVRATAGEISVTTGGQRDGIGEVHLAIRELDEATQRNSALVEQSAAAAESLREQAGRLSGLVNVFQLDPSDGGRAEAP
ncbi:MAG TPA: methyl-accepting chemotaxis protein [Burkholderiaceae bacterium]|nr:methyl-accepting chemotaxis protein [Burkholderiaceae bacterium]